MKTSIVKDPQKIAKTKLPSSPLPPPNMNGQSIRTRKDESMKPEVIRAAQHLLQLYVENLNNRSGNGEEDEVKYQRSHKMNFFDKFKVQDGEEDKNGGCDDEECKSEVSYITDDSSEMETTLADISAAQQIMELSSNSQQQAAEDEDEDEEEATMYNTDRPTSSGVVSSVRKDFEGSNVLLPRKRKFRSLADLYQITQPLEDDL